MYPQICTNPLLIKVHVLFPQLSLRKKWELQIQQLHTQCDLLASSRNTATASLQEEMLLFPHDGFFGEVFAAIRYKLLNMHLWNKWISRCSTFVISHILGSYECFFYELTQFRSTFQTPTWGRGKHLEVFLQNQQMFMWNFPQKAPRKLSHHEQMLISPGKCPCPSTEKWALNLHC